MTCLHPLRRADFPSVFDLDLGFVWQETCTVCGAKIMQAADTPAERRTIK